MSNFIRISFCGDLKLREVDGLAISNEITDIMNRCDFNVINFEAPVFFERQVGIEKSGPNISQNAKAPSWVESHGWNVVSLANNHAMDYGNQGLTKTMHSFRKSHLVGAGTWDEAYKPLILEARNRKRIGIIACSHREFGCLHDEYSQKTNLGYAWICHPSLGELVVETRKKVDVLFLYAHAGVEHLEQPLPEWRSLYKHYIDMGCDGVIASHPHIPMGYEIYNGKPIYYSLGNFCFQIDSYEDLADHWNSSIMVELTINDDNTISTKEHLIVYNPTKNIIHIDKTEESACHIKDMNSCLVNDKDYMTFINQKVIEMLPWYMKLFSWSGLIPIPQIQELPLRTRIKNKILGRIFLRQDHTTKTHLLNNLQCESHRWTIQRALNIMYNID